MGSFLNSQDPLLEHTLSAVLNDFLGGWDFGDTDEGRQMMPLPVVLIQEAGRLPDASGLCQVLR